MSLRASCNFMVILLMSLALRTPPRRAIMAHAIRGKILREGFLVSNGMENQPPCAFCNAESHSTVTPGRSFPNSAFATAAAVAEGPNWRLSGPMNCQITASVNAGLAISIGGVRIWCDALHGQKVPSFSTLTPERWSELLNHPSFQSPDLLFFTHCHADHYSADMTAAVLARYPQAFLALPKSGIPRQIVLQGESVHLQLADTDLLFVRLPHEGIQYAAVPHYGCILTHEGFRVLLTGDCAIAAPELAALVRKYPIDLAVMDFPWITLRRGREFLENVIQPHHLLVNHLPLAADDTCGYLKGARTAVGKLEKIPDLRLVTQPFQQETYLY